jgi:DNA-binding winged helix-turn-helix (wHTH) protein
MTFQFGEFTYDGGSRLLTRGGIRQHLSPKAQQLLQLLLDARPRAVSREALYDALWPSTFVCETNLAGIVKEVRRALGDDARASQYIRTVHGFGYAFEGEIAPASSAAIAAALVCGGKSYPLYHGENSIGRAPDARVLLTDSTISRRHAVITIHEGGNAFLLRDLQSKNGTFVNGRLIGPELVTVPERAKIEFGTLAASVRFRKISTTQSMRLNMPELKRQIAERMPAE